MIPTLSSNAFAGQLRDPHPHGISPIFRGRIELNAETIRCYIKPLPDYITVAGGVVTTNRELLNEALGYTIAKAAGFSVASNAGIIMLTPDQIPPATLAHLREITPPSKPQDDYLAWFSEDMQQPSLLRRIDRSLPQPLLNRQLAHVAKKLAKNSESAAIVSFDEWTENSDRNLGNLLERADGRLSLIDHGWLFRSPVWSPMGLGANPIRLRNVLRELIDSHEPSWSEKPATKSARLLAYTNLAAAWRNQGATAAQAVLAEFLEAIDQNAIMSFLSDRLDPPNYKRVVGLLV